MKGKKAQKSDSKPAKAGAYNKYPYEKRMRLISMVEEENRTLASAARELQIAQTTARLIMSTWKAEQRVFEKKSEREKRLKRQAKKRASAKKKWRSQRLRPETEEVAQSMEVRNALSIEKREEISENIQNQPIHYGVPEPQRAENPEPSSQLLPQTSLTYQVTENEVVSYFWPIYWFPSLAMPFS